MLKKDDFDNDEDDEKTRKVTYNNLCHFFYHSLDGKILTVFKNVPNHFNLQFFGKSFSRQKKEACFRKKNISSFVVIFA